MLQTVTAPYWRKNTVTSGIIQEKITEISSSLNLSSYFDR